MTKLVKRWTLPDSVLDHIVKGDVSGTSHVGFHTEAEYSLENKKLAFDPPLDGIQAQRRSDGKSYWGKAILTATGEPLNAGHIRARSAKASGFFPHPKFATDKPWNRAYIKLKIEQALTSPGDTSRKSRQAWTDQPRQIRLTDTKAPLKTIRVSGILCGVIYQQGVVESVYPIVEGFMA